MLNAWLIAADSATADTWMNKVRNWIGDFEMRFTSDWGRVLVALILTIVFGTVFMKRTKIKQLKRIFALIMLDLFWIMWGIYNRFIAAVPVPLLGHVSTPVHPDWDVLFGPSHWIMLVIIIGFAFYASYQSKGFVGKVLYPVMCGLLAAEVIVFIWAIVRWLKG